MSKRAESVWLVLTVLGLLSGCNLETYEWEEVGSAEHPLFLEGNQWPDGIVPVCWSATSQGRSDFALLSRQVRDILNASWPAAADVEFTGWEGCPSNTAGLVVINLINGIPGNATLGYKGNVTHEANLGATRSDFDGGPTPHEFGHILGFGHEMRRPDFEDDDSGTCQEDNGTGDTLETPADRESVMASTGYCQYNRFLSRWDLVGVRNAYGTRAENVVSAGNALYARKRSNGDIYQRVGSNWVRIGGPGGQFVAVGSTLYGLARDSNGVHRYGGSGTTWTRVGGAAREILRCAASLCATNPITGKLYRYSGSGTDWTEISDEPAAMYASTSAKTYRLTADRQSTEEYSGSGHTWIQVGGPASFLFSTTTSLFATDPTTGDIYRYSGSGTSWTRVGAPGRTFVGVGSTLYGLSVGRDHVHRYSGSGTSWTRIGGAADWIYGGESGSLYATNPSTHDIYRDNGTPSWEYMGQP